MFQYTLNDIHDLVQGSETEIMAALEKMQALLIDGKSQYKYLFTEFRTDIVYTSNVT